LYQKGELEDSLVSHELARDILLKALGEDHPQLAPTFGSIGNVFKSQKKYDDALIQYRKAHGLLLQQWGTSDHPDVASSHNNIGLVLAAQSKFPEALEEYQKGQQSFAAALGAQHPHTGSCHFNIALVQRELGDRESAAMEVELARSIWEVAFGPNHPHTKMAEQYVTELNSSMGP
jgi:tetratricopeptide (TPR) repeat protein